MDETATTNSIPTLIHSLIKKAEQADKSEDALRFSQAACNVSHVMEKLLTLAPTGTASEQR